MRRPSPESGSKPKESFFGGNVAVELFAFMIGLQIKIGALSNGFIALLLGKNLLAEGATPEAINRFEFADKSFSLCGELFDGVWHGVLYLIRYNMQGKNTPSPDVCLF